MESAERAERVEANLPLVRRIVIDLMRRMGFDHPFEFEELLSAGTLGLIEAVERDDGNPATWVGYAARLIRYAIYEEMAAIRGHGGPKRAQRQREIRRVGALSDEEAAERLGVGVATVRAWRREAALSRPLALDMPVADRHTRGRSGRSLTLADVLPHPMQRDPLEHLFRAEVRAAFSTLLPSQREILRLVYLEGREERPLARERGVTRGALRKQIETALRDLRAKLGEGEAPKRRAVHAADLRELHERGETPAEFAARYGIDARSVRRALERHRVRAAAERRGAPRAAA